MKKLFAKLLICCCLPVFGMSLAFSQRSGVTTFTATDVHDNDVVPLSTLTPTINLPLLTRSKGMLPGGLSLTSPQSCHQVVISMTQTNTDCGVNGAQPLPLAQFYFVPQEMIGMSASATYSTVSPCFYTTVTSLIGADGISSYPIPSTQVSTTCTPNSATVTTYDGSGLTATLTASSHTTPPTVSPVINPSGWKYTATGATTGKVVDPFGNTITLTGTSFTDTLGAVTTVTGSPLQSLKYNDTSGTQQTISLVSGTQTTFQPLCATGNQGTSVTPITSISLPDGTSYGFTWDTNSTGIDGLISQYTLRTGGSVTFNYGGTSSVLECSLGLVLSSLKRTDSDGETDYTLSQNTTTLVTTTTVLDPGKNKTVYVLWGLGPGATFNQSVTEYQNTGSVASPSYTKITSTTYCYNTHISDCSTYSPVYPITQLDTYKYVYKSDGTQVETSHDVKTYDSTYGLLLTDANTDEITSGTPTITKTIVYGTYVVGTGCQAITNTNIVDHPCTVTTTTGGNTIAQSGYTYNTNGALTQSFAWTGKPSTNLTTTYTPNTTGTYSAIQDPNGQTTNYTYGSCNSLLPTDATTTINSIAIDKKTTWDSSCNGLAIDTTDNNSNEDDTTYDSMNRIHTHNDRIGDSNTTTYTYGTPTLDHVKVVDPMGVARYTYNDGLGRPTINQTCQTSACTSADTVSKTYSWKDSMSNALTNFQTTTSEACSQTLGNSCSTVAITSLSNPVAGPVSSKDVNLGTTATSLDANDVSVTIGPAPTNENTKTVVTEKNGFDQVTSVCAVETSNGSSSCGQLFSNSGILTSTAYTYGAGTSTVTTTRGSQTHTAISDALGRKTSFKAPETGSTARTFSYDSQSSSDACTTTSRTSNGDLLRNNLPDGTNYICYIYDGLHRSTDVKNSIDNSLHPCKRFRYDSTANGFVTTPSGYPSSGANIIGRLMEAETDDCNSTPTTYTDEWFAYDNNGRMTDMWEKTPNSGSTYYHTTVAYDADGVVTTISGIPGYTSNFTFTTDGEDRPNASKFGTTTVVSATAGNGFQYDNASRPLNVPWGTAGNQDTFTYDGLENMTVYNFAIGSTYMQGALTWNKDGSLQQLAITDQFNSGGSQTCKYLYDDVGRLGVPPNSPTPPNSMGTKSVDCGTNYNGEYGWDQYNNLTQAGTNSWAPGYSSSNNQMTGSTYDTDGNVTYDGVNSYATNVYAKLVEFIAGNHAVTCGTNGTCITYDASDRAVEMNNAGTYSQILYGPTGRLGIMNGQTASSVNIPQPGGGSLVVNGAGGSSNKVVMHRDWLGTVRLGTLLGNGNVSFDTAYAPFSQTYNTFGTINNNLYDYTGDLGDIAPGSLFDTPNRELFVNAGRWIQPEFSGSFNGYSYVTDPNKQTDPSGLNPFFTFTPGIEWSALMASSSFGTNNSTVHICQGASFCVSSTGVALQNQVIAALLSSSHGASSSWDNSGQCGGGLCAKPLYGGAGGSDKGLRFLPAVIVPWPTMWDGYYDPYNYFQFDEMRDLYNTTWDGFTPEEIAAINDGTYGLRTAITEEELGPIIGAATVSVSAQWLAGDWVISKARDVINPKPVGTSTLSDIPAMYNRVVDTMYDLTFGWFLPISHLPSDPNVKSTLVPEAVSCSSSPVCY